MSKEKKEIKMPSGKGILTKRHGQVIKLRLRGLSYPKIGRTVGTSGRSVSALRHNFLTTCR